MRFSWLLCLSFSCCLSQFSQNAVALDWISADGQGRRAAGDVILIQHEEPVAAASSTQVAKAPAAAEEVAAEIVSSPEGEYVYLPGSDPATVNYPVYGDPTQSWDYNVAESLDDGDFGSVVEPALKGTHVGVFGDYLYLTPRNAEVPYAAPFDLALFGPNGPPATVDPGYSSGYRFGAFVTVCPDTTIRGTYTTYDTSDSSSIALENPGTALPTNLLVSLVDFPGFSPLLGTGVLAQAASANYEISYQLIDLDYEAITIANDTYWGGFILGARYAKFDQDFNATFQDANVLGFGNADTVNISSAINFEGIGLRGGLQGERHLFASRGFRVYGQGVLSLLAGEFKSSYRMRAQDLGLDYSTSYSSDRIVPVLDLEAGVAWVSPRQHVRISAGYMISAWYNIVTTNDWIHAVQQQNFTNMQDNITFDGLVARAQVSF